MTVSKIGPTSWYSSLAEQEFDSEMAARHYDGIERLKSQANSPGSKLLDSLSADQLKSLILELNVQADQFVGQRDWQKVQEEFVANNPEYLANTQNGSALAAVLVERGKLSPTGIFLGSMGDMQDAFIDLAEKGVLKLKEGAKLPTRADEAELYALPLDELHRRARGL